MKLLLHLPHNLKRFSQAVPLQKVYTITIIKIRNTLKFLSTKHLLLSYLCEAIAMM